MLLVCGTGAAFFSDPARVATLRTAPVWETSDIGVVWSDDFNRATLGTNWVSVTGNSPAIVGNELFIDSGASDVVFAPWFICSDSRTLRWTQRFSGINANSYGIGVGLKNMQVYGGTNRAYNAILSGSGGWFGQFVIEQHYINQQYKITNGPPMALAAGDIVDCTFTRAGFDMTATASNRANGQVSSCAFVYSIPQLQEQPTISSICIYGEGGPVYLDNISFTINRRKPARFIVLGDSVSDGFGLTTYATEYRSVIQSNYAEAVCNDSSSYNVTSNVLMAMPEILAHKPGTAILMIGGNDLFLNVPTAQWKTQYSNIVSQLQGDGVLIKHCLPTPRNNVDLRPLRDWILTNYPGPNLIDLWTPLLNGVSGLKPGYDTGDGVHPNAAGHTLMGSIIRTNLP